MNLKLLKALNKALIISGISVLFLNLIHVNVRADEADKKEIKEVNKESTVLNFRPLPVMSDNYRKLENISSEYAVLLDEDTNTVLAGKGALRRVYPASLTKVLTLITALDFVPKTDIQGQLSNEELSELYAREASLAGFAPGEKVPFKELLYGLILPSGADGAVGIEKVVGGNKENFSVLMNLEAARMGLFDSRFKESSGLHNKSNYSTALDIAIIFGYALDNKTGREVLGSAYHKTGSTEQHPEGLEMWSHTFAYMEGVDMGGFKITAGKTGYTGEAKVCMVTEAEKDGHKYILVTLFAPNSRQMCEDHINIYKEYAK